MRRRDPPCGMLSTGVVPQVLALVGLLAATSGVAKDPSAKPSNVTFRQMSGTTFATATNKSIYRNAISVNRLVRHNWPTWHMHVHRPTTSVFIQRVVIS